MDDIKRQKVFQGWLDQYRGLLFKVIRLYAWDEDDRNDLFQDISVQMWLSIPGFRGECRETTWLYRIALNTSISWLNSEKRRKVNEDQVSAVLHQEEEPNEKLSWLYNQMKTLDPLDRSVCLLLLEDYSYKEIAEILGTTENYVGVKIHRIKNYLKAQSKKINHGI